MALVTNMQLNLATVLTKVADWSTPTDSAAFPFTSLSWSSGTGANLADLEFHDRRTLAGASNEALDLAGVFSDSFGVVIAFARIKLIAIYNRGTVGDEILSLGGAAANQFINWVGDASDVIKIRPGGLLILAAPDATAYAVTAGTGDQLKIANAGAGAVNFDIYLLGASA